MKIWRTSNYLEAERRVLKEARWRDAFRVARGWVYDPILDCYFAPDPSDHGSDHGRDDGAVSNPRTKR